MDLSSTTNTQSFLPVDPLRAGTDEPDTPSIAVAIMRERWRVLDRLWGGTPVMREATELLPQEDGESDRSYEIRRKRSTLLNGWKEALMRISSAPFRRPVSIQGESPPWVEVLEKNVNKSGRDLTQFCHEVFFSGWYYGFGVIMGEAPARAAASAPGGGRTRGDTYLVDIPPSRILGATVEYGEDGAEIVTKLRVLERSTEPDGEFKEKLVERVREYEKRPGSTGRVRVWERDVGNGEQKFSLPVDLPYTLEGPGGGLPIFPAYVNYTGPLQAEPPLEDLAWHNVQHWQSSSDQSNILRFARCATLAVYGATEEDLEQIVLGANRVIPFRDGTTAEFLEHSGEGVDAGFKHLDRIEQAMERQGMQPLLRDSARVTATAQHINAEGGASLLEQSARALENAINDAFAWLAETRGEELPEDFRIHVTATFDTPPIGGVSKPDVLLRAATAGLLPRRTFLEEMKRDGYLSAHTDVDAILEEIETERQSDMSGFEPFSPDSQSDVIGDGQPQ